MNVPEALLPRPAPRVSPWPSSLVPGRRPGLRIRDRARPGGSRGRSRPGSPPRSRSHGALSLGARLFPDDLSDPAAAEPEDASACRLDLAPSGSAVHARPSGSGSAESALERSHGGGLPGRGGGRGLPPALPGERSPWRAASGRSPGARRTPRAPWTSSIPSTTRT
ncbi:MAG: hypothetical protein M0C28_48535 [Candidatus Moduliflexus flocculans]|nr:hypothetical protein [Candidatus Moduliflexus flocculans]